MSTRFRKSQTVRLLVAASCALVTASCGGELLRTGRSPVYLQIDSLVGAASNSAPVLSDVADDDGSVFNDFGRAQISVRPKDQTVTAPPTTALNTVTITRYRVEYRRTDGRNTPGVDVPFSIDGAVTVSIPANSSAAVPFDLVRHAAKLEPPLRNLMAVGGQVLIATVAEVTFYGRDQNGNEVMVSGMLDVTFGDFPDS